MRAYLSGELLPEFAEGRSLAVFGAVGPQRNTNDERINDVAVEELAKRIGNGRSARPIECSHRQSERGAAGGAGDSEPTRAWVDADDAVRAAGIIRHEQAVTNRLAGRADARRRRQERR